MVVTCYNYIIIIIIIIISALYFRSDNPCHLMCKDVTKPGAFRHLSSSVMDGVRCDSDSGTLNVCLHGQCRVREEI